MKIMLAAGSLICLFVSGVVFADCLGDCKATYRKDIDYCKTLGDPNAQGNCITRANETFESCRNGCK